MRFTQVIAASALAALAKAVILTDSSYDGITVGQEFDVGYSGAAGTVTLYLATGTPDNVVRGDVIGTSSSPEGTFQFTPTQGGSFAFEIVDAGAGDSSTNPNYSPFFNVAGGSSSSTTGSGSSTTGSATSTTAAATTTGSVTTTSANSTTTLATTTAAPSKNGTVTTTAHTGSSSGSSSTGASGTVATQVPSSMAAGIASPLAFVFVALAALVTLN